MGYLLFIMSNDLSLGKFGVFGVGSKCRVQKGLNKSKNLIER